MSIHTEAHPLAGETVTLGGQDAIDPAGAIVEGAVFKVEDWCDRVMGVSWMCANINHTALVTRGTELFDGYMSGIDPDWEVPA